MTRRARTGTARVLVALGLLAALAACGTEAGDGGVGRIRGEEVVVASFNFPESRLLAEIYAGAIESAGIPVRREIDLGPRELVQPALLEGLVDVVPEYLGTALVSVTPESTADRSDPTALRRELETALARWGVHVREPAPAQNQNGFAVTRATARRLGLRQVSDLAPVAGQLTLGGPPECPRRIYCLEGLERVYGVHVGRFLPLDGNQQRVTALEQAVVDVAVMFSTDGQLATGDLVLLADDRRLQPAENVVPVVSDRATRRHARLGEVVDAVSARLTTNSLVFLNWRVSIAGKDVGVEARAWLRREGLVARSG